MYYSPRKSVLVHNLDVVNDVNGDSNGLTSHGTNLHVLQVIPGRIQAAVRELNLNFKHNIRIGTWSVRTLIQKWKARKYSD